MRSILLDEICQVHIIAIVYSGIKTVRINIGRATVFDHIRQFAACDHKIVSRCFVSNGGMLKFNMYIRFFFQLLKKFCITERIYNTCSIGIHRSPES